MPRGTRIVLLAVLILSCVGCDQVTKAVARSYLAPGQSVSFLGDTLRLVHTENPGAFLSMGESLPGNLRTALFTIGAAILVAAALGWALFSRRLRTTGIIGAALVCAGGIGNLVDRVMQHGHVTDFLNVGVGALRTGIFNVADFVLLAGLAFIAHDGMTDRN